MSFDNNPNFSIEELIPHSGMMLLIDRVVKYSDNSLIAGVTINEQTLFLEDGEVPSWVGIEYMAQTIAAYAGVKAKLNKQAIKIGLLLGTRSYHSSTVGFKIGSELTITVKTLIQEKDGLGVFNCEINSTSTRATATLNVYQPDDIQTFLSEMS